MNKPIFIHRNNGFLKIVYIFVVMLQIAKSMKDNEYVNIMHVRMQSIIIVDT